MTSPEPRVAAPAAPPLRNGRYAARASSVHGRRRPISTKDLALLAGVAVASAGIAAVGFDAAPTGWGAIDALWRGVFAAVMTLLTARARRWTWFLAPMLCALLGEGAATWLAATAAAAATAASWLPSRSRALGALSGALVAPALLSLRPRLFFGAPSIAAGVVAAAVAASAYRSSRSATRRRARWIAIGLVGAGTLVGLVAGMAALSVRSVVDRAVRSSLDAIEVAQDGQDRAAAAKLRAAAADFGSANRRVAAWWLRPASLIPVVSQHLRAVESMTADGRDLTLRTAAVADRVDFDGLRRPDGGFDVAQLEAFRRPLDASLATLRRTRRHIEDVSSGWLVPPIGDRITDLSRRLSDLTRSAELAADAARHVPDLLGADGPRRYFVMLITPAEARDLGGHMANFAELSASDGKLTTDRSSRVLELIPPDNAGPALDDGDSYPPSYRAASPWQFPQNLAASPDLDTVARAVRDLYPKLGGRPVDGVLTVDPAGFAAMLRLTGPLRPLPDGPQLSADTAEDFLLRGQYTAFPDESKQSEFLRAMVDLTTDRLFGGQVVAPRAFLDALGPAVARRHLRFTTFERSEREFLSRTGLHTAVRRPANGDLALLLNSNLGPNKMDAYLKRRVDYQLVIDRITREITATATVELRNEGPTTGSRDLVGNTQGEPPGTNISQLSLLTPLELLDLQVDGASAPAGDQLEFRLHRYSTVVRIPPGRSVTVTFVLRGKVSNVDAYQLRWLRQPLAQPDEVRVGVRSAEGLRWAPVGSAEVAALDRDRTFRFRLP